jgi:hypothetical protein
MFAHRAIKSVCLQLLAGMTVASSALFPAAGAENRGRLHLRYTEDAVAGRLQAAIRKLRSPDGAEVHLIGAVHVADQSYFEDLNRRFKNYQSILYELVGEPEPGNPLGARGATDSGGGQAGGELSWLPALQEKMRRVLDLSSQLEHIDYTAPNFVHADMTVDEFLESRRQHKETFLSLWLRAMQAQMAMGGGQPGNDLAAMAVLMRILSMRDSAAALKRLVGREFDRVEDLITGLEAGGGTVILGRRNEKALSVLDQELEKGGRRVAVFYGAAHLPDMEARLVSRGFELTGAEWLDAWTIPHADADKKPQRKKVRAREADAAPAGTPQPCPD